MTYQDGQTPPEAPQDPVNAAAEMLLYGSPEEAAAKLREAIHAEAAKIHQHQANTGRLRAEQTRSQAALQRFRDDNPEFVASEAAVAAGERFCYSEQIKDLEKVGLFDRAKFRAEHGRDATFGEIGDFHLLARSNNFDVRPVDEILNTAADRVTEEMPQHRRRLHSEEASRKRAVLDRQRVSARSRGVDINDYLTNIAPRSRQPNLDSGEPVTTETMAARERREAGEGGVDLTERRSAAFQKHFANRVGGGKGTDRRPNAPRAGDDVQLNMDRNSRCYPDRQAG